MKSFARVRLANKGPEVTGAIVGFVMEAAHPQHA